MAETVDPERLLLSWCFNHSDLLPVINEGLLPDDFEDDEHAGVLEWALAHYREHNASPGLDALRLHDPNWRVGETTDGVATYVAAVRERQRYNVVLDTVQQSADLMADDQMDPGARLERAIQVLTTGASELATRVSNAHDEDITLNWQQRADFYDELRATPGRLLGLPTGFHTVDRATNGIQPGQFIMLAGPPGSGKSTSVMVIGKNINMDGNKVLLISFEMNADEQKSRWDAIWGGVSFKKIQEGRATRQDMKKIRAGMQKAHDGYPFYLSTDIARVTTVSGVAAKIEKFQPQLCIVDGVYLMQDERGEAQGSPQALKNIAEDFKRFCQQNGCPVFGTTQTNTARTSRARGVTADSLYGSQAFHQNADVLFGLQPADDEEGKHAELRVLKSRHGPLVRAQLLWDWEDMTFEERFGGDGDDESSSATPTGGY